jgi:hypothetical protein
MVKQHWPMLRGSLREAARTKKPLRSPLHATLYSNLNVEMISSCNVYILIYICIIFLSMIVVFFYYSFYKSSSFIAYVHYYYLLILFNFFLKTIF